jgi:2-polyprenyl-3-methyl-5-hydroxy-6-metoxy-1,4-benzoquinol methylase
VSDANPEAGYFGNARAEMLAYVPASARRVLELGCGAGVFGASVKARGAEVWGVELNPAAARAAEARLDRVLCADVETALAELPRASFDCVVYNDVLEHLVDPRAALTATKALLAPGGVVVCSIPNVRHFRNLINLIVHKQWRYEEHGVLDRTHLRFFTERSIVEMFDELGYDVRRLECVNGYTSWKYKALGKLSLGFLSDVFTQQFGCVAAPRA